MNQGRASHPLGGAVIWWRFATVTARASEPGLAMRAPFGLVLLAACTRAELTLLKNDEAFEETVIQSGEVWAVLFTSPSKGEDAEAAEKVVDRLSMKLSSVQFALADVDSVKAFASEFNIRKRMVPRLAVFASRARQVDLIPMKGDALPTAEALEAAVLAYLAENAKGETTGRYEKLTLAIGGGGEDKEL